MMLPPTPSRRDDRIAYAKNLNEFDEQRSWFSTRASDYKNRARWFDLLILMCGALIAFLPILKPGGEAHWTEIAVSALGAVVVLVQGAQRVFRYGETWPEYRFVSERMKREWRLFINARGAYATEEDEARSRYVDALDRILAEEQQLFSQTHRKPEE